MFADDTHLTFADNDITKIERNLNDDLASISTSNIILISNIILLKCPCQKMRFHIFENYGIKYKEI